MRGLRLLALAAALTVVALLVDARGRAPAPGPAVLLAVPEAPPAAAAGHTVPIDRPAAPGPAGPAASEAAAAIAAAPSPGARPAPAPVPPTAPLTLPPSAPRTAALPAEPAPPPAPEPPAPAPPAPPAQTGGAAPPAPPPPAGTVRDGVLAYQAGDYARAFAVWRPLAEAGNARAQFHLGALYLEGRLGPPDPAEAYLWLARAAAGGQQAARPLRDRVAEALPPERLAELDARLGAP